MVSQDKNYLDKNFKSLEKTGLNTIHIEITDNKGIQNIVKELNQSQNKDKICLNYWIANKTERPEIRTGNKTILTEPKPYNWVNIEN